MEEKYLIKLKQLNYTLIMNEYQKAAVDGIEIWKEWRGVRISNLGNVENYTPYCYNDRMFVKDQALHRIVAELFLGWDGINAVHHINKDKLDNRCNNLVVLTVSEHTALHNKSNGGFTGKHHTDETKTILSDKLTGTKKPESMKEKLSERAKGNQYAKGHVQTNSTKELIRQSKTGVKFYNNGTDMRQFRTEEEAMSQGYIYKGMIKQK